MEEGIQGGIEEGLEGGPQKYNKCFLNYLGKYQSDSSIFVKLLSQGS
jgi:hypothetical protein